MPEDATTDALLNELIDLLIHLTDESEKWTTLLTHSIPDSIMGKADAPGLLGRILRQGAEAGVSEPLGRAVIVRYAAAQALKMPQERILSIVESTYRFHRIRLDEAQKGQ
jgi:hypothetical protein